MSGMYRFSGWLAVVAMLLALVSGPLFHIHDADDHEQVFAHAHFLESEDHSLVSQHAPEIEADHSHDHVRWLDIFRVSGPPTVILHLAVEVFEASSVPSVPESRALIAIQTLHAHGPPPISSSAPRSPPTV